MSNVTMVPYRFRIIPVVLFDASAKYNEQVQALSSKVTGIDGKAYNLIDGMAKGKDSEDATQRVGHGIIRGSLRKIIERLANNYFVKENVVVLDTDKLPKSTNGMKNLIDSVLESVSSVIPFAQDDLIISKGESITVSVQAPSDEPGNENETQGMVEGSSEIPPATDKDLLFKNFFNVDGWTDSVKLPDGTTEIRFNVCIRIYQKSGIADLMQKTRALFEKYFKGQYFIGAVINTNDLDDNQHKLFIDLVGDGFTPFTPNSNPELHVALPASKTAMAEKVFKNLCEENADIVLIK